jgi:hypothetical protein
MGRKAQLVPATWEKNVMNVSVSFNDVYQQIELARFKISIICLPFFNDK